METRNKKEALANLCDQAVRSIEDALEYGVEPVVLLTSLIDGCMPKMDSLCEEFYMVGRPLYWHYRREGQQNIELLSVSHPDGFFDWCGEPKQYRTAEEIRDRYAGEWHPDIMVTIEHPMKPSTEWTKFPYWLRRWSSILRCHTQPVHNGKHTTSRVPVGRKRWKFAKPMYENGVSWHEITRQWEDYSGEIVDVKTFEVSCAPYRQGKKK